MKIIEAFVKNNLCYRAGGTITVKGLMLHSVGCPQPSAEVWAKKIYSQPKPNGIKVCVHAFLEPNNVYQILPWNMLAWHSGDDANFTHIGVEMCEPDCIKYTSGANFTCSNTEKAKKFVTDCYSTAVELFAYLCKEYNLDPLKDIISHSEGHKKGIASGHSDPEHLWKGLKLGFTMDGFRKDVKAKMDGETTVIKNSKEDLFRVQVGAFSRLDYAKNFLTKVKMAGFSDAFLVEVDNLYKIQVGAFSVRENAENMLERVKKAGFEAFITNVKVNTASLKIGDKVKLSSNATIYGTESKFFSWVYNSVLYVRDVDEDRIVISVQKTGDITGAVHRKYITKA